MRTNEHRPSLGCGHGDEPAPHGLSVLLPAVLRYLRSDSQLRRSCEKDRCRCRRISRARDHGFPASRGRPAATTGPSTSSGHTYSQAVQDPEVAGLPAGVRGSVGSDVPQSQCIVESQKMLPMAAVSLMLNCTKAAQPPPGQNSPVGTGIPGGPPGPPHVGSNGVTTVTPTPVGPQPREARSPGA